MANSAFHPSGVGFLVVIHVIVGYGDKTAEGVVRGVAYRPRQRVLLAARLECRLAAGSRPRNGDERRSLALWAVESLLAIGDFVFFCLVWAPGRCRLSSAGKYKCATAQGQLALRNRSLLVELILCNVTTCIGSKTGGHPPPATA